MTDSLVLIDSRSAQCFRKPVCGKIFWHGRKRHSALICEHSRLWMTQCFLHRVDGGAIFSRAQKCPFHKGFRNVVRFHLMLWTICAFELHVARAAQRRALGIERRVCSRTLAVNRSQCFLLSLWCNPDAVHVDPRRSLFRHRHIPWLGGQQMAKKRKAKKAKKAKARKKK
jgi:hypothetical protein